MSFLQRTLRKQRSKSRAPRGMHKTGAHKSRTPARKFGCVCFLLLRARADFHQPSTLKCSSLYKHVLKLQNDNESHTSTFEMLTETGTALGTLCRWEHKPRAQFSAPRSRPAARNPHIWRRARVHNAGINSSARPENLAASALQRARGCSTSRRL